MKRDKRLIRRIKCNGDGCDGYTIQDDFIRTWQKYFNTADLSITFNYTHGEGHAELVKLGTQANCLMAPLRKVRRGASFTFVAESVGYDGGREFLGFADPDKPDIVSPTHVGVNRSNQG